MRAPSSMPAPDSRKTVFDDDDVAPPTTAPAPSTISAERSRGKVPAFVGDVRPRATAR